MSLLYTTEYLGWKLTSRQNLSHPKLTDTLDLIIENNIFTANVRFKHSLKDTISYVLAKSIQWQKNKNIPLQNILDKSWDPNVVAIPNEPWPGPTSVHPLEQQYECDRQPNKVKRNLESKTFQNFHDDEGWPISCCFLLGVVVTYREKILVKKPNRRSRLVSWWDGPPFLSSSSFL